jgi:hypothetical protein
MEPLDLQNLVLLGQSGIPVGAIEQQIEIITRSPAFEGKYRTKELLQYLVEQAVAGKVPRVADVARAVFKKEQFFNDDAIVRNTLSKLRELLEEHYKEHAKAGEIQFHIRPREYLVFAPPRPTGNNSSTIRRQSNGASENYISSPENNAEVHHLTTISGRLDALSLDTHAWLVTMIPNGVYYPACRVSRETLEWEHQVRLGLGRWGTDEGTVYEVHLIAAGDDGDYQFYRYLKSGRDGFSSHMPTDCRLLDKKRFIRRDNRPDGRKPTSA